MEPSLDLSVIVDMETMQITGELVLNGQINLWRQAAEAIAPRTYEIIICSRVPLDEEIAFPENVKLSVFPGLGYYGMKNKGAEMARGRIVFFTDVDCRPEPDYLVNLLRHFASEDVQIVGGRTFYDGTDFATRVGSVVSFGYLHGTHRLAPVDWYLGHNVAIRNEFMPAPFGPYTERFGGDLYITHYHRQRGEQLEVKQDLVLHHESYAHSLWGLLERHLREITSALWPEPGLKMSPRDVLRQVPRTAQDRRIKFKKYVVNFNFTRWERWRALALLAAYQGLNTVVALLFILRPGLLKRWNTYHFIPREAAESCAPSSRLIGA